MSPVALRSHGVAAHCALALYTVTIPAVPASSLTFPNYPSPLPPQGLSTDYAHCLLLGNCPPGAHPSRFWRPFFTAQFAILLCVRHGPSLGPKCRAIHVRPLPHSSCHHPTSGETCIQKVLKQWLYNKGKRLKEHLQPHVPWLAMELGTRRLPSCHGAPLCTPHLFGPQPCKNHYPHLALR